MQALEPITYQTSRQYQSPILPDLDSMEDIQNKEDVRKLCEFFQVSLIYTLSFTRFYSV